MIVHRRGVDNIYVDMVYVDNIYVDSDLTFTFQKSKSFMMETINNTTIHDTPIHDNCLQTSHIRLLYKINPSTLNLFHLIFLWTCSDKTFNIFFNLYIFGFFLNLQFWWMKFVLCTRSLIQKKTFYV